MRWRQLANKLHSVCHWIPKRSPHWRVPVSLQSRSARLYCYKFRKMCALCCRKVCFLPSSDSCKRPDMRTVPRRMLRLRPRLFLHRRIEIQLLQMPPRVQDLLRTLSYSVPDLQLRRLSQIIQKHGRR